MKRGWSREFATSDDDETYYLNHIPAGLWRRVRAKAAAEEISVRTLILRLLTAWLAE